MTKPLALVLYERLLPGTQLVNRLQDLGYRISTVSDPTKLPEIAREQMPMVVLVDFSIKQRLGPEIRRLREHSNTAHIPVIAYCQHPEKCNALDVGATLVAGDAALVAHLAEFLDHALRLD